MAALPPVDTTKGGSGIDDLYKDAGSFLSKSVVSCSKIFAQDLEFAKALPSIVQFKLVETQSLGQAKSYFLKYDCMVGDDSSRARNARPAYLLGYLAVDGQLCKTPAFVDIPKRPDQVPEGGPRAYMLFTGMLSGCSVVVTSLNDTHYRIFHDPRVDAADLYDQFVGAIEHREYRSTQGSTTTVLMQFSNDTKTWSIHAQGLLSNQGFENYELRQLPVGPGEVVLTKVLDPKVPPRPWVAEERLKVANKRREQLLERMRDISKVFRADDFVPPRDVKDEPYKLPVGKPIPRLESCAVQSTQVYFNHLERLTDRLKLVTQGHDIPGVPKTKTTLEQMSVSINIVLGKCKSLDLAYLWLLVRQHAGEEAVLVTSDPLRAELHGGILGEMFDRLEVRLKATPTEEVTVGYERKDWATARIPGIEPDAPLLAMKQFCVVKLPVISYASHLGTVLRRIETAASEERASWLKSGNVVIRDLQVEGYSDVRPMPLDVISRLEGSTFSYALVRIVAAGLWTGGAPRIDRFLARLANLRMTTADTSQETRLLLKGFRDLRSNIEVLQASTLLGQLTIDEVKPHLLIKTGTASRLFALNTQTHSMLLGLTVRKNSVTAVDYHFYDPNFAMVTYNSLKAVITAVEGHLLHTQFAKTYSALYKQDEPPRFYVFEIDGGRLAQVDIDSGLVVEHLCGEVALTDKFDGGGLPDSEAATKALTEDPAFKIVAAAAEAQTAFSWAGPFIWEGKEMIRVPEDSVVALQARVLGLQLDDGPRPGFSDS